MKVSPPLFSCFFFLWSVALLLSSHYSNGSSVTGDTPLLNVATEENSPLLGDKNEGEQNESDGSWTEDAEYVAAVIASLAGAAACFKYRGREGYERIPDARSVKEERSRFSDGDGSGNSRRRSSSQFRVQETATAAPAEREEKRFRNEAQGYVNQQIYPRTQMVERALLQTGTSSHQIELAESFERKVAAIRGQGEKFVQFFKNNFENIFQYQQRTPVLERLMESYVNKLTTAIRQPTTPGILDRVRNVVSDPLVTEHARIMGEAQQYVTDFDAGWEMALAATRQQYDGFLDLQTKSEWLNTTFPQHVQTIQEKINERLDSGAVGEPVTLRTGAIKKFFNKTHQAVFANGQAEIKRLTQVEIGNFSAWYRQLEVLRFWGETEQAARITAQELMSLADQKTSLLLERCNVWKEKAENAIRRGEDYYDAVHHHFPELEKESEITPADRALVIKGVDRVNLLPEKHNFYPSENDDQKYLEKWIRDQYNEIVAALKGRRSYFSVYTYISPLKGTLSGKEEFSEDEKKVLCYFLSILKTSRIDFIRSKAAALKEELDS